MNEKNSVMDKFFALGDKATKGDPIRKAQFDYALLWVIFFAFISVAIGNIQTFMKTGSLQYLGWVFVMLGILWFQYYGLKSARQMLKSIKSLKNLNSSKSNKNSEIPEKLESVDEMLKGFK